jgi:hypothetical protein
MIVPERRSGLPFTTASRQFQRDRSRVRPRLRAMFAYFVSPGSLCVVVGSAPVRYSITAVSDSSPLADEKAAAAIPSISTMKCRARYGWRRGCVQRSALCDVFHRA